MRQKKNMAQVRSISKAMSRARHGERGKDRDKKTLKEKNDQACLIDSFDWTD